MSNPARAPVVRTSLQQALAIAPEAYLPAGYDKEGKRLKPLEAVLEMLAELDMEPMPAFVVPREYTVETRVLNSARDVLAMAPKGVVAPRKRTKEAQRIANAVYMSLPTTGYVGREEVGTRMAGTVLVDGGAENALGRLRLAYPKKGVKAPPEPVTAEEAAAAAYHSGLVLEGLPAEALKPYVLVPLVVEDEGVKVNLKSNNGFPVGGTYGEPAARNLCDRLAARMRQDLSGVNVYDTVREMERHRPYMVFLQGKCKADYYKFDKIVEARMRFYNVLPRHVLLNMQVATQVLEHNSRHILLDPGVRTAIGITLTRGGAEQLVSRLDEQLMETGQAYVHQGDDSFVALREGGDIVLFALDCSNFDLTQHGDVTLEIHKHVRDRLRPIDQVAADLWYAYARERVVVVSHTVARRFKHAGPSGMPLQSKVNDMIMDVALMRTMERLRGRRLTEDTVAAVLAAVARGMGLSVRLEQFARVQARGLREALESVPFLFIGYYFYAREGRVRVHADIPRMMAQLPYPSLKWMKTDQEVEIMEAMRLGSIYMNLGEPTPELEKAYDAFRVGAEGLIKKALADYGDKTSERLRWAVQENPFGAAVEPSLSGLLRAVTKPLTLLWGPPDLRLATMTLSELASLDWADEVEEEEAVQELMTRIRTRRIAPKPGVTPVARLPPLPTPAKGTGRSNDGRAPPKTPLREAAATPPAAQGGEAGPSTRMRRRDGLANRDYARVQQMLDTLFYENNADDVDDDVRASRAGWRGWPSDAEESSEFEYE